MEKYITLPSGKTIQNISKIEFIDSIKEYIDNYSSPIKSWVEFNILYTDDKNINLSYDVLNTAKIDRDFLLQKIHLGKNI